jgi:hypothetical protein
MKFLITFNHVDGVWDGLSPAEQQQHGVVLKEFVEALEKEKNAKLVFFHPAQKAKTVRQYPDGRVEVLDGPYQQSNEQPGGYYIIETDTLDEALEWARRGRFMTGSNEVRQLADFSF